MRKLILASFAASCLAAAVPANATPLSNKTIHDVMIDGTSYNVTFIDASLSQVPQSFQFTFPSFNVASDAIKAIIATPDYATLVAPANTVAGTYYSGFIVPYGALLPPTTRPQEYNGARFKADGSVIAQFPFFYYPTNNDLTTGDYTFVGYPVTAYALPDGQQLADLPEPASIALVALGLFCIGFLRRRT